MGETIHWGEPPTGGGSGTGWDGEAVNFAALPPFGDHLNEVYLVKEKQGSQWTFNLKRSGFYIAEVGEWRKISNAQFLFNDNEFTISNSVDQTKQIHISAEDIATSTQRLYKGPDLDGTFALLEHFPNGNFNLINTINGYLSGAKVTVNAGDNTKIDIEAGKVMRWDWSDPLNVTTEILELTVPKIGLSIPSLAAQFTVVFITGNDTVLLLSGHFPTGQDRRDYVQLQSVVHTDGISIDSISTLRIPAGNTSQSFYDYIIKNGAINTGNTFTFNGANLNIDKASGTTTLPFIDELDNPDGSADKFNPQQLTASVGRSYRDGGVSWTSVAGSTTLDWDFYDDGSGVLAAMPPNKWQIIRCYFFGQVNVQTFTYGQAFYNSQAEAEDAIFSELPMISPGVLSGSFVTALIVKEGTLGNNGANKAIPISFGNTGGVATVPSFQWKTASNLGTVSSTTGYFSKAPISTANPAGKPITISGDLSNGAFDPFDTLSFGALVQVNLTFASAAVSGSPVGANPFIRIRFFSMDQFTGRTNLGDADIPIGTDLGTFNNTGSDHYQHVEHVLSAPVSMAGAKSIGWEFINIGGTEGLSSFRYLRLAIKMQ